MTHTPRIIFHPAECCPKACDDAECIYTHFDGYEIEGTGDWSHRTEADAKAAISRATNPKGNDNG